MDPCVSVVLPVYNVANYVEATIASILRQTFTDFELLVIDDCSTDETAAKVQSIDDPRLRFIQNDCNLGRAGTDNAALPYVRGKYLAKMDGDDICHRERLAHQVAHLEHHPEVNVVGSWMQNFGTSNYLNLYPTDPSATQVLTLFTLPIGNPSVMLRMDLFREGMMRYDETLRQTEDYDFFARYVRELRVATLPEPLIRYRVPPRIAKTNILTERATVADEVRARLLCDWGINYTARELHVHNTIAMLERPLGDVLLSEVEEWLRKIIQHNERYPLFEPTALRKGLAERWFEVCYTHPQPWLGGVREFARSNLAVYYSLGFRKRLKFWTRGIHKICNI
jgi:glycosyltransferase involved in cell wall biosynthesis